jgi:hypothetical protein
MVNATPSFFVTRNSSLDRAFKPTPRPRVSRGPAVFLDARSWDMPFFRCRIFSCGSKCSGKQTGSPEMARLDLGRLRRD